MPADEMTRQDQPDIAEITRRLLRPYTIRPDTPDREPNEWGER